MHLNPLDEETAETIRRHKAIIHNKTDDFIAYIHHTENARIAQIKQKVFEQKKTEFAVVDDKVDHSVSTKKN